MNLISKAKKGTSPSLLKAGNYRLSIQVQLDGFSFCIFNVKGDELMCVENHVHFPKNQSYNLLGALGKGIFLSDLSAREVNFETIDVLIENDLYTLVPKPLYDSKLSRGYLELNVEVPKNNVIKEDIIESIEAVGIYSYTDGLLDYLKNDCKKVSIRHFSTYFVNYACAYHRARNGKYGSSVCIYVLHNLFYIIVLRGQEMILCNHFFYGSNQDFIYYILFVYKKLHLQAMMVPIVFFGDIGERDECFKSLQNYIKGVYLGRQESELNCDFYLDNLLRRRYYSLLNPI